MRVGIISYHSFLQPGGIKRHVLGLQEEFKKRGIYSKIIAPRRKRKEFCGKDVILLGTSFPISFSGSQSDFGINFNPLAIEKTLKKEKFNILHFHNFGFPSTLQILVSPALSNTLNILTFHANIKGSKFLKKFPLFFKLLKRIIQWRIDGIIGVAKLNLEPFKKYPGPKIVIPHGIDLEVFNPDVPKIKKFLDEKINILFVGRIEKRKGLIYLLRAYKILEKNPALSKYKERAGLRLIIVGEGPLKKECQNFVKENNLKEIYFEGEKTGRELVSYYATSDIFVSPAIFGESFGLVLLEAMASGLPIVAFANLGYKEFLKEKDKMAFLVKPRDYQGLTEKLEILIKNPQLRKEMGEWGIKEAQNYSWSKVASQVLDFYNLCKKEKNKKSKKPFSLEKSIYKIINKILPKVF